MPFHGSMEATVSSSACSYRRFIWPMWAYVLSRGYYQFTNGYTTETAKNDGTGLGASQYGTWTAGC